MNGFYVDNYINQVWNVNYNHPAFFTELWTGWFSYWGGARKFTRPAYDVAFSVARFVAKGGSLINYYMWHGGTNFGRTGKVKRSSRIQRKNIYI